MEESREKIKELMEQEEDLLSYILFPQVALEFFKKRREQGPGANPGVSALADEKTPGCASGGGGAVRNSSDDDEDPVYPA